MKLHPVKFGLAMGILWALAMFVLGLIVMSGDYGAEFVALMSTVYLGYEPTIAGAFVGAIWGFVDAFIGGWLFAWLYNKLLG